MVSSLDVPISAKLRLCQPVDKTRELAQRLQNQGASWITLHARTVSARRRRQGPADLSVVKDLKSHLDIPVISNGNVRAFSDLQANLDYTAADGLMVGETLLDNPCLFANVVPDPFEISLEYLNLCTQYPETAALAAVQAHIRHFVGSQCNRQPWYPAFHEALKRTENAAAIGDLLRHRINIAEKEEEREAPAVKSVLSKGSSVLDDDRSDSLDLGLLSLY